MEGWLPLLIPHVAGRRTKPHPKHSQEIHKDPTGQDTPVHTVYAFWTGAARQEDAENDPMLAVP